MNCYKKHKSLPDGAEVGQISKFQFQRENTSGVKCQLLNFSMRGEKYGSKQKYDGGMMVCSEKNYKSMTNMKV